MEKWMDFYTSEQLQQIQDIERGCLDVLNSVCEELNIKYFLYGGSLIGAVRHQGFIPWDDDLDVAMIRADYERFIECAPKYLSKEYYLQSPYGDKKTPFSYAKLRVNGTKFVEYGYHKLDINHGIYVDIYPIDKLPKDIDLLKKQHKSFQRVARLYAWRQCPYVSSISKNLSGIIRRIFKGLVSLVLKTIPQKYFIKKLDDIAKAYGDYNGTCIYGNLYYPEPKNLFDEIFPLINVKFDNKNSFIPRGWKKHLKMRYGDYMQLPPETERIGHKPYVLQI